LSNVLRDLKITSVDLVPKGANPEAHIKLFKSDTGEQTPDAETADMNPLRKALSGLVDSIAGVFGAAGSVGKPIHTEIVNKKEESSMQDDLMTVAKEKMMQDDFAVLKGVLQKIGSEDLTALYTLMQKYNLTGQEQGGAAKGDKPSEQTGGQESGGVTKGQESGAEGTGELHPDVKKALEANAALSAKVEELRKSLELQGLTAMAKKFEVLGKVPEELAVKLYELKKAGGTAYDDYVALLEEQATLLEKSGVFGELGRNTSGTAFGLLGGELYTKAAEVAKADSKLNSVEALIKAYESSPELAAQYEADYLKGRGV